MAAARKDLPLSANHFKVLQCNALLGQVCAVVDCIAIMRPQSFLINLDDLAKMIWHCMDVLLAIRVTHKGKYNIFILHLQYQDL